MNNCSRKDFFSQMGKWGAALALAPIAAHIAKQPTALKALGPIKGANVRVLSVVDRPWEVAGPGPYLLFNGDPTRYPVNPENLQRLYGLPYHSALSRPMADQQSSPSS